MTVLDLQHCNSLVGQMLLFSCPGLPSVVAKYLTFSQQISMSFHTSFHKEDAVLGFLLHVHI